MRRQLCSAAKTNGLRARSQACPPVCAQIKAMTWLGAIPAAIPFEAKLAATSSDETVVRWLRCDLCPPVLKQAAQLFQRWTYSPRGRRHAADQQNGGRAASPPGRLVKDCLWLDTAASDSRRMVTTCRRGSRPTGFRPSRAEAYSAATWTCRQSVVPVPPPHCGTFGTPPGCVPVPLGRPLVRRFRWSAIPHALQPKNSDFAYNYFYTSWVGRKRPDRADRMPLRGDIGCKLFKI
jgi:hypothetical protein